jgi:hypothetical protein
LYAIVKERSEAVIRLPKVCGADRDRTDDIQLAKLALSQLSYSPKWAGLVCPVEGRRLEVENGAVNFRRPAIDFRKIRKRSVGLGGFEPPTPRLSSVCSNQLSYRPVVVGSRSAFHCQRASKDSLPQGQTASPLLDCENVDQENRGISPAGATASFDASLRGLLRKEVIQPQVPLRLPCYDFTPVTSHSLGGYLLAVSTPTSGATDSHGVTGGVYKARERIHRSVLIYDY